MKGRIDDPRRLDVARFAGAGGHLDGQLGADALARLAIDAPLAPDTVATWSVDGELRRQPGGAGQTWLALEAGATVLVACQRCLQPMAVPLAVDRHIRFVATEEEAERLDEEGEDDVLARPPRGLDLIELVEDELILALPLVPRHEHCPQPLPATAADETPVPGDAPAAANPFAALAALKPQRDTPGDDD